jgi:starch synthase
MKIFHASAEFYPYIKMGGLSDMLSSLAKEQAKSHEVQVAIPLISKLKANPTIYRKKIFRYPSRFYYRCRILFYTKRFSIS